MSEVKAKNNILEDAAILRLLSRYGFRRKGDVFIRGKAERNTVVLIDFDGVEQRDSAAFLKTVMSALGRKTTAVIFAGNDCSTELRCHYLIEVKKGESGVNVARLDGNITIDFSADENLHEQYINSVFSSVHAICPDTELTDCGIEARFATQSQAERVALLAATASCKEDARLGVFAMPVVKRFSHPYFPSEKAVHFFMKNGIKAVKDFTSTETKIAVFADEQCRIYMNIDDVAARDAVKRTLEDINGKKTRLF